ncbi:MAG: flippase [Methanobacterium sp.]|nr:flippase [Methanobacterium sp.]
MNTVQRIVKNIGFSGVSQVIITIIGFVLIIYLARYLGEAEFGTYNLAIYFTSLFIPLADLGISQFMIRELARDKKRFDSFIICSVINIMGYSQEIINLVYLFGIYTIISSFVLTFRSIFQAYEKLEYTSLLIVVEKVFLIPLVVIFIIVGLNLKGIAYGYIISIILTFALGLYLLLRKIKKPKIKVDFKLWKIFFRNALPFGLNSLFTVSFVRVDTVILSYLKNDVAVGIYNAAYAPLLAITSAFATMVVYSVYPVMSRYFISSKDVLKTSTILTCKYMAIISLPMTVGCFILAGNFINLFYGNQYQNAIFAFQILSLFIPLRLISSITGTFLTSINKQGIRTFCYMVGLIFNVILNIVMIPYLSYIGASIATVLSEILVYVLFIFFISKYYSISQELHKTFIKPLIASLIMGAFLVYFNKLNLFILIVLAMIIYFILLLIQKTFTDTDKHIINQLLGRFTNE